MDDEKIRAVVIKRLERRNEFLTHLGIYIAVNLFLWGIWFVVGHSALSELGGFGPSGMMRMVGGFPWPLFVTFGWGIGLFAHAMQVYNKSGMAAISRERIVQREIERERQFRAGLDVTEKRKEKPKNDAINRAVHLSDDGEMVYDDQPQQTAAKSK